MVGSSPSVSYRVVRNFNGPFLLRCGDIVTCEWGRTTPVEAVLFAATKRVTVTPGRRERSRAPRRTSSRRPQVRWRSFGFHDKRIVYQPVSMVRQRARQKPLANSAKRR